MLRGCGAIRIQLTSHIVISTGCGAKHESSAHLPWVEEIIRVYRLLYSLHQFDSTLAKLLNKILALPHADTVFSSTCSLESNRSVDHTVDSRTRLLQLFVVSEEQECVEVACIAREGESTGVVFLGRGEPRRVRTVSYMSNYS